MKYSRELNNLFTTVLLALASLIAAPGTSVVVAQDSEASETKIESPKQEYYELRIYRISDYSKMQLVESYLKEVLLPAFERMGIDRVGVFTNKGDVNDHSVFMFIPFKTAEAFTELNAGLSKDEAYQKDAKPYFDRPLKDPLYSRIESRFMKAFAGMPVMKVPDQTKENAPRIFELRLYESHTEGHAARKVEMFNDGEIGIMEDANMGPVFFGETLIGPQVPNLIYMLSASNEDEHKQHWQAFLKHPEWNRIKVLEKYKDTVSKIKNWFLVPTPYSKI